MRPAWAAGHVARKNNENKKREGLTQRSGGREGEKLEGGDGGRGEKEKELTMSKEIKKFGYHALPDQSVEQRPSIYPSGR